MKKYNHETEKVHEYLVSLEDGEINRLLSELTESEDLDERMDICEEIIDELEFMFDIETEIGYPEWFDFLVEDLKELTLV